MPIEINPSEYVLSINHSHFSMKFYQTDCNYLSNQIFAFFCTFTKPSQISTAITSRNFRVYNMCRIKIKQLFKLNMHRIFELSLNIFIHNKNITIWYLFLVNKVYVISIFMHFYVHYTIFNNTILQKWYNSFPFQISTKTKLMVPLFFVSN